MLSFHLLEGFFFRRCTGLRKYMSYGLLGNGLPRSRHWLLSRVSARRMRPTGQRSRKGQLARLHHVLPQYCSSLTPCTCRKKLGGRLIAFRFAGSIVGGNVAGMWSSPFTRGSAVELSS